MAEITLKRIQWIDCAKAVAITAVAVDHCNRVIYTNPAIAKASYFSVTLFIFLSGITAWNSSFKSGQVNPGGGGGNMQTVFEIERYFASVCISNISAPNLLPTIFRSKVIPVVFIKFFHTRPVLLSADIYTTQIGLASADHVVPYLQ